MTKKENRIAFKIRISISNQIWNQIFKSTSGQEWRMKLNLLLSWETGAEARLRSSRLYELGVEFGRTRCSEKIIWYRTKEYLHTIHYDAFSPLKIPKDRANFCYLIWMFQNLNLMYLKAQIQQTDLQYALHNVHFPIGTPGIMLDLFPLTGTLLIRSSMVGLPNSFWLCPINSCICWISWFLNICLEILYYSSTSTPTNWSVDFHFFC